jgi:hypothetical protein
MPERTMKNRNYGSFETRSRRRMRLPVIPIALVVILAGVFWLAWTRGGEQPQKRVEITIPADKLGK